MSHPTKISLSTNSNFLETIADIPSGEVIQQIYIGVVILEDFRWSKYVADKTNYKLVIVAWMIPKVKQNDKVMN